MEQKLRRQDISAVLIAGPTASGKSALALEMARDLGGEIVNADSMQVYGVLDCLTARPGASELEAVPHHLYGHVSPATAYSTGIWLDQATQAIAGIRSRGALPVAVGGTGLYFRALTGGLSDMPAIPDALRTELRARLESGGVEPLHRELAALDSEMAARLRPADRQRILRALEVVRATGRSILEFQGRSGAEIVDPLTARCIVLEPDRQVLHARINARFARMVEDGAIDEVRQLMAMDIPPQHPAMKAIGVSQLATHLAGRISLDEAVDLASAATRQYAKRQMTWFRNQLDGRWERMQPEVIDV
ncbi:tRNA delta(2)-isopentenylpyrophosphate transferase [Hoeflea sp. BAL378]|uniref:tRNA (adenosine(37)-N6)-dimethylallyltransferase MiaA n=1 Tax=Hoeflea sp. BAL378 TaxID=1547437 RepID=UPI000512C49A|nr:tRNA (adenosine(37)-N6)-dimethylallyltransferase MiaA [Hoeflea sp. BAL378]KGF68755.1 tRNA delta(2)-isopentenylpyrophosphate transferase [Hoeflea sp. BAL378]